LFLGFSSSGSSLTFCFLPGGGDTDDDFSRFVVGLFIPDADEPPRW